MRIRTIGQLDSFLDDLLSWRKKELTQLFFAVMTAKGEMQRTLLRAAITLLYAHWEGFIKASATGYVQFVALQKLLISEAAENFLALGLRNAIRAATQSLKVSDHIRFLSLIESRKAESLRITWQRSVNTRSNLKSEVFKEIVMTVGLNFDSYALKAKPVIDRLVDLRNAVSHGQAVPIEISEYSSLHNEVVLLLDQFKTELSDAASAGKYRRANT